MFKEKTACFCNVCNRVTLQFYNRFGFSFCCVLCGNSSSDENIRWPYNYFIRWPYNCFNKRTTIKTTILCG